jgi:hypothetical protein
VGLLLIVIMLFVSLSNLSSKVHQNDTKDTVTKNLEIEGRILLLENKINDTQLRIAQLEKEIRILKSLTVVQTTKPISTIKPSPTNTPASPKTQKSKNPKYVVPKIIATSTPFPVQKLEESVIDNTYKNGIDRKINTNITEKSNLTSNEIDSLLNYILTEKYPKASSKLLNSGNLLRKMEDKYNVNALYALSVASFETNWGTQGVARQNNLFAFINNSGSGYIHFNSVEDSIMSFGSSARNSYFNKGVTSVKAISKIYCPPNHLEWTRQVNWLVSFYADNANKFIQN